jgi:hypothetical protein
MSGESSAALLLDGGGGGGSPADPLSELLAEELRDPLMDHDGGATDQLVLTPDVAANMSLIAPWLKAREPFILVRFVWFLDARMDG